MKYLRPDPPTSPPVNTCLRHRDVCSKICSDSVPFRHFHNRKPAVNPDQLVALKSSYLNVAEVHRSENYSELSTERQNQRGTLSVSLQWNGACLGFCSWIHTVWGRTHAAICHRSIPRVIYSNRRLEVEISRRCTLRHRASHHQRPNGIWQPVLIPHAGVWFRLHMQSPKPQNLKAT